MKTADRLAVGTAALAAQAQDELTCIAADSLPDDDSDIACDDDLTLIGEA